MGVALMADLFPLFAVEVVREGKACSRNSASRDALRACWGASADKGFVRQLREGRGWAGSVSRSADVEAAGYASDLRCAQWVLAKSSGDEG